MTLWAGRVGGELAPEVWDFLKADDTELLPYDIQGTLLHADRLEGPWVPHRLTPVKIDIAGARPAGPLFKVGEALFRPGQDCSRTYGGGIAIHRVDVLNEDTYRETKVSALAPDPDGPFPDGIHTLAVDGDRVWVDGKRFVLDMPGAFRKLRRRIGLGGRGDA